MLATSAGIKTSQHKNKHILSSCFELVFHLEWHQTLIFWSTKKMQQVKRRAALKSTWDVNWRETRQAAAPSRGRSTRLWSLLYLYGRLQRWNVRPVNTEGKKNQHLWHKHPLNVRLKENAMVKKMRKTMLGDECKMKENRPWVECNGCAISACIQCIWIRRSCMHLSHCWLYSLLMKTVYVQTSGYITASRAECDTFLEKKTFSLSSTNWS